MLAIQKVSGSLLRAKEDWHRTEFRLKENEVAQAAINRKRQFFLPIANDCCSVLDHISQVITRVNPSLMFAHATLSNIDFLSKLFRRAFSMHQFTTEEENQGFKMFGALLVIKRMIRRKVKERNESIFRVKNEDEMDSSVSKGLRKSQFTLAMERKNLMRSEKRREEKNLKKGDDGDAGGKRRSIVFTRAEAKDIEKRIESRATTNDDGNVSSDNIVDAGLNHLNSKDNNAAAMAADSAELYHLGTDSRKFLSVVLDGFVEEICRCFPPEIRWLGSIGVGVVGMKRDGAVQEGEWECLLELATKHHYESIRRERGNGYWGFDDGNSCDGSGDDDCSDVQTSRSGRFDSYASYNGTYHAGTGVLREYQEANVGPYQYNHDEYNEDDHFILPYKRMSLNHRGIDRRSSLDGVVAGYSGDYGSGSDSDNDSDSDSDSTSSSSSSSSSSSNSQNMYKVDFKFDFDNVTLYSLPLLRPRIKYKYKCESTSDETDFYAYLPPRGTCFPLWLDKSAPQRLMQLEFRCNSVFLGITEHIVRFDKLWKGWLYDLKKVS